MFDTEPYYHIPTPKVTPIWECPVNDAMCAHSANRQANRDRRVDWNMIRIMQSRLRSCNHFTTAREESPYNINEGYEVLCGPLEETIREMQAAFELKWGNIQSIFPNENLAQRAYMKQKNRHIEDRFRHRMMEHVGGTFNVDTITEKDRWVVDGLNNRPMDWNYGKSIWDIHLGQKEYGDFPKARTFDIEGALDKEHARKLQVEASGKDSTQEMRERQAKVDEKYSGLFESKYKD